MFLTADQIKLAVQNGDLEITGFSEENLKPASYTFKLDSVLKDPKSGSEIPVSSEGYELAPGSFVLGRTRESVNLRGKFVCILGTRGSLAQQGVDALQSSSIAEPDTNSCLTLEITNQGPHSVVLLPGMKIVKGAFSQVQS